VSLTQTLQLDWNVLINQLQLYPKYLPVALQIIRNDAFQELEEVLPALVAAQEALNALNKNDIVEVKSFSKPPNLVQLTLEGVCGLLGEKADWESARRVCIYVCQNLGSTAYSAVTRVLSQPVLEPTIAIRQSNTVRSVACTDPMQSKSHCRCSQMPSS
jgi:hypothetical protein